MIAFLFAIAGALFLTWLTGFALALVAIYFERRIRFVDVVLAALWPRGFWDLRL